MSAWTTRRRALFLAASVFVVASSASSASAETVRRHRAHLGRTVQYARAAYVPLQPFSMDAPSTRQVPDVRVAAWAPPAIPRGQRAEQDEETQPMPEMELRSSGPTVAGNRAV